MRVAYALSKVQHMQEELNAPAPLAARLHEPELPPLDQAPQIDPERAHTLEAYPGSAVEQGGRFR